MAIFKWQATRYQKFRSRDYNPQTDESVHDRIKQSWYPVHYLFQIVPFYDKIHIQEFMTQTQIIYDYSDLYGEPASRELYHQEWNIL